MKKATILLLIFLGISLISYSQKIFNSNGRVTRIINTPDEFKSFEKYEKIDTHFTLYPDKVIINGFELQIERVLSESGFFSKTIHVKLIPNEAKSGYQDYYDGYTKEMIVEYTIGGEIEWIKTKIVVGDFRGSRTMWTKHAITTNFVEEENDDGEKVNW